VYINRLNTYLILIALAALLSPCTAMAAANNQSNISKILEINDSTLNSTLARYPLFILDCYEAGCDPCQRMNGTLDELSLELSGQVIFGKINADENNKTASMYNVTNFPTLLIFKNGTFIEKEIGYGSKAGIVDIINRLKPGLNTILVETDQNSATQATQAKTQKESCSNMTKLDQPVLQAFVVSYCPFGLQMQRVLSGVVDQIPSLSGNIKVRYIVEKASGDTIGANETGGQAINFTSMHGQTEADENLRQICIREEQPNVYWRYISCFLESGNSSRCINTAGVDEDNLNGCLADKSRGLRYVRNDYNLTQQFKITASPTLVMNGQIVSEHDFGGRTEDAIKNLLCCGFSSRPVFCSINLSKENAKIGFTSTLGIQPASQSQVQTSLATIPLAKVGENNPPLPVLVTDQTVSMAIKKYPLFVLMGFADWCEYCRMMNATILELSKELQGKVTFGLIDAEKNNETAEKYGLVSYPKLLIFRNGTLINAQIGYKSTSDFSGILEGLVTGLNTSRGHQALPPSPVASQRIYAAMEITDNATVENDKISRYLDKILEAAEINRTDGNVINIFITIMN
jgi:thioredoxin 1